MKCREAEGGGGRDGQAIVNIVRFCLEEWQEGVAFIYCERLGGVVNWSDGCLLWRRELWDYWSQIE